MAFGASQCRPATMTFSAKSCHKNHSGPLVQNGSASHASQ